MTYQPGDVVTLVFDDDDQGRPRRYIVTRINHHPNGGRSYDLLLDPEDDPT